jgi:cation diffusion facilitator CzcD-associated flavoprotein CzcO
VTAFNLNIITSAKIQSTVYEPSAKKWTVKLETPAGQLTVVSKHLVQATGIGSQEHYIPKLENEGLYKGISLHSVHYKNANKLKEQGARVSKMPILV